MDADRDDRVAAFWSLADDTMPETMRGAVRVKVEPRRDGGESPLNEQTVSTTQAAEILTILLEGGSTLTITSAEGELEAGSGETSCTFDVTGLDPWIIVCVATPR